MLSNLTTASQEVGNSSGREGGRQSKAKILTWNQRNMHSYGKSKKIQIH